MANPFLKGWNDAGENQRRDALAGIAQLNGLMSLQNNMRQNSVDDQVNPLKLQLLQQQVAQSQNPAPLIKDLGGSFGIFDPKTYQKIGEIPKSATPDAALRERGSMERHQLPSGSALLGEQGAMQRHVLPSGSAQLGANVSLRGQNMTDSRAREGLEVGKWTNDLARGIQINTATGQSRPITQGGAPLAPVPSESQRKELMGIGQQEATVQGALDAVLKTPSAFGFSRGAATMAGALPESLAGRLDSKDEREARSYVFNVVSKVINERAGAAQSAQELARLRSFLPAEMDSAKQIEDKLTGFQKYLGDMRSGTTGQQSSPQQRRATDNAQGWSIRPAN